MGPQGFTFVITKFVGKNLHFQKFKSQMLFKDKKNFGMQCQEQMSNYQVILQSGNKET